MTVSRFLPVDRAQQRQDAIVRESTRSVPGHVDAAEGNVVVPLVEPTRANDAAHDGAIVGAAGLFSGTTPLELVEPLKPDNGAPVKATVILINGIMTDLDIHQKDMQALANTGCQVLGIRNATQGMVLDLVECLRNKLNMDNTPAVNTTVRALAMAVDRGQPVHLVGHSQGALIIARALQQLRDNMLDAGLSPTQVKKKLALIDVETYGGASSTFVDGPRYQHSVNAADVVPMLMGVGLDRYNPLGHAGEKADIRMFVEAHRPKDLPPLTEGVAWTMARAVDQSVHGPRDVYFKHRKGD